jgi:hypothetical protein
MYNFEQQMNQYREQARQAGFSGNAIIDVHPSSGVIRIKVSVPPKANIRDFITGYTQFLTVSLGAMNIEARVHFTEEEK